MLLSKVEGLQLATLLKTPSVIFFREFCKFLKRSYSLEHWQTVIKIAIEKKICEYIFLKLCEVLANKKQGTKKDPLLGKYAINPSLQPVVAFL